MRTRLLWCLTGLLLVVSGPALSACGRPADHEPPSVAASPASVPSVPFPASGVGDLLARFVAANNAANAARDDALLRTVESGTSLALDLAGYAVSRGTDPSGSRAGSGFDLVDPTWWVTPVGGAGPRWAVVRARGRSRAAGSAAAPSLTYLAFVQEAPGRGWLLEYAVDADPGSGPVPDPTGSPCSGAGDTAALSRLVAGWLASLGGRGSDAVAGELFRALRAAQVQAQRVALAGLGARGELDEPQLTADVLDRRPERVASLTLPGGGCLAFFATQERRTYRASTAAGLTVAGAYRALGVDRGGAEVRAVVAEVVSVDQWLAVVPPDGTTLPGQILGHAGGLVEVRLG